MYDVEYIVYTTAVYGIICVFHVYVRVYTYIQYSYIFSCLKWGIHIFSFLLTEQGVVRERGEAVNSDKTYVHCPQSNVFDLFVHCVATRGRTLVRSVLQTMHLDITRTCKITCVYSSITSSLSTT